MGIGETLAATGAAAGGGGILDALGGLFGLGAAAAPAEAAVAAPVIGEEAIPGIIAAAESGAAPAAAGAATDIGTIFAPAAAAGGAGAGEALGLGGAGAALGAGLDALGNAIIPSAGAAEAPAGGMLGGGQNIIGGGPGQGMSGGFPTTGSTSPAITPTSTPGPSSPVPAGGGGGAAGIAAPAGTSVSDTGSLTGFDQLAMQGGGGAAGTAPGPLDLGTAASSVASATPAAPSTPGSLGGIGEFLNKNPLLTVGAGGLASTLASPLISKMFAPKVPQQPNLDAFAKAAQERSSSLLNQEQQFLQPSLTGELPPAAQAQVDTATQRAILATKQKYASLGLSGSTMEQSDINQINQQAQVAVANIAQTLAGTGLSLGSQAATDLNLQGNVYSTLMDAQIKQDQGLQNAIANFAGQIGRGAVQGGIQKTGRVVNA